MAAERLLECVGVITAASRDSPAAVLSALHETLALVAPALDATLVFQLKGLELECIFCAGARTEYFYGMQVAADSNTIVTAAVVHGHHVVANTPAGVLIPTDRVAMAVPMRAGEHRAIVYVSSKSARKFAERDAIVTAVSHAAVPYALALEREADRKSATYDGLTGLYTARSFREALKHDLSSRGPRNDRTVVLWFVDTDGFKRVNDTLGHAAGDAVLQRLANLLRAHLRPGVDLGARNGGDEFCAILQATQKTAGIERAKQFCDAVRAYDFGSPTAITASVGVAAFPYDAHTANALLELADAAMYHSKRSGRDCVSFVDPGGSLRIFR